MLEERDVPDLADYLEGVAPEGIEFVDDVDSRRWRIVDKGGAAWIMRRLRSKRRQLSENVRVADDERARIDAWVHDVQQPLLDDVVYFEGLLAAWHVEGIRDELDVNVMVEKPDPEVWRKFRGKTLKLPHGEVAARAQRGSFMVGESERDTAIDFLMFFERADLLTHHAPSLGAQRLDAAVENAPETIRFDGVYYWIPIAEDRGMDPFKATAIKNQLEHNERVTTVLDTFVAELPNAFAVEQSTPNANEKIGLTVTQELGDEPVVTTWLKIPGISKTGVGSIAISVKVDES